MTSPEGTMLWTAFLLGLAGSLHCAGMCGPLVLALPATGSGTLGYVAGRLVYQGGRLMTYVALGAAFGLVGQSLAWAGIQRWVSIGAGLLILASLGLSSGPFSGAPIIRSVAWLQAAFRGALRHRSAGSLAVLGLLNGLLPCGLVYVAAAGAAATGEGRMGAEYMAVFGLGTLPVMLGISLSGRTLPMAWRARLRRFVPACIAAVGILLILRGLSLGIPYLSPDFSTGTGPHCH